MSSKSHNKTSC